MRFSTQLPLLATLSALLLTACGSSLPNTLPSALSRQSLAQAPQAQVTRAQAAQARSLQTVSAQNMKAQYFNVLLNISYTPDDGVHFGFDRFMIEFTDSRAKFVKVHLAFALQQPTQIMLSLEQIGSDGKPQFEQIATGNKARRAQIAAELRKLQSSPEDNALLAKATAVIAGK